MHYFIILSMVFLSIVDDFYLQGFLASAKQRSWWVKNYPDDMYKRDYLMALLIHSFSWTFMMMLPLSVYFHFHLNIVFLLMFSANMLIHAIVDDIKANRYLISLEVDQLIHLGQICITAIIVLLGGAI